MFRIDDTTCVGKPRVISDEPLTDISFREIARSLDQEPRLARKAAPIAARQALHQERIETRWNGKETEGDAAPGDWIVTALANDGLPLRDSDGALNIYVIDQRTFEALYSGESEAPISEFGALFRARGTVEVLRVRGGFEIMTAWGEMQRADDGWLVLSGRDVHGNHRDTFCATYELIEPAV